MLIQVTFIEVPTSKLIQTFIGGALWMTNDDWSRLASRFKPFL